MADAGAEIGAGADAGAGAEAGAGAGALGRPAELGVAIVGSGFGGLGAAIRLRQEGIDFAVFERADELGGTWRDNSYPGCACDVPSHLYSFSFAPNPGWTRSFSGQPEIFQYLKDCADRFGVRNTIKFGHEVLAARWDDTASRWQLDTTGGRYTARVLVAAAGPLNEPSIPDLKGLGEFSGAVFHSARWDHDVDLTGRDVAVIGTGASAVQFVPAIQPYVRSLRIFQRTPPWVVPRRDRPLTRAERRLYAALPGAQRLSRWSIFWGRELFALGFLHPRLSVGARRLAQRHLRRQVSDPQLRARLQPEYTIGCKRILVSNDYLPALTRDNVEVVTEAIEAVETDAIVTTDGQRHRVDTIVFGTGFQVAEMPIADRVRGREGRTLADVWQGSPRAYLGTSVPGFPNLFLLLGPNTGLGHNSVVMMIESQIEYVLKALRYLRRHGLATVEPRAEAERGFVSAVDQRMQRTVWSRGRCRAWYFDRTGRNFSIWPGYTWAYRRALRRFDPIQHATVGGEAGG